MPGFDINHMTPGHGSMLHIACHCCHVDFIKYLLEYQGFDVNALDDSGHTALHDCIRKNKPKEIIQLLLLCPRVDITIKSHSGLTPLHLAALQGKIWVIKMMFFHKGSIFFTDKQGIMLTLNEVKDNLKELGIKNREAVKLLIRSHTNPKQVSSETYLEYRDPVLSAAHLFVLIVMLCDEYLTLKHYIFRNPKADRFFKIMRRLPIEIQMIICNKVHGLPRETIRVHNINVILEYLFKLFIGRKHE